MLEAAFSALSFIALIAWVGLAVASAIRPSAIRSTILLACGRATPILLCVAYAAILVVYWGPTPGGGFQSLAAVQILLSPPEKMLGAWTHFLAFDLLVGRWMVDDALSSERSRLPLVLALPATLMLGPVGVLVYLAGRTLVRAIGAGAAVER
jgi:hypothetical protein